MPTPSATKAESDAETPFVSTLRPSHTWRWHGKVLLLGCGVGLRKAPSCRAALLLLRLEGRRRCRGSIFCRRQLYAIPGYDAIRCCLCRQVRDLGWSGARYHCPITQENTHSASGRAGGVVVRAIHTTRAQHLLGKIIIVDGFISRISAMGRSKAHNLFFSNTQAPSSTDPTTENVRLNRTPAPFFCMQLRAPGMETPEFRF